jgi:hypothetical protein
VSQGIKKWYSIQLDGRRDSHFFAEYLVLIGPVRMSCVASTTVDTFLTLHFASRTIVSECFFVDAVEVYATDRIP